MWWRGEGEKRKEGEYGSMVWEKGNVGGCLAGRREEDIEVVVDVGRLKDQPEGEKSAHWNRA